MSDVCKLMIQEGERDWCLFGPRFGNCFFGHFIRSMLNKISYLMTVWYKLISTIITFIIYTNTVNHTFHYFSSVSWLQVFCSNIFHPNRFVSQVFGALLNWFSGLLHWYIYRSPLVVEAKGVQLNVCSVLGLYRKSQVHFGLVR